ncbi:MAG: 16S rRNA (cytidine(1402)-2'-O)-methyltransferase [Campylobacterales bacterium]|nr:16S rRNA (cytidine(1402)-2'-O)-methyltransferase [Campylobacterales bacterium]
MLTFIPTPIGNPQDITIRALKSFESAVLFLCEDTRQTKRLLHILSERFEMNYPSDAQFVSFNEHNGSLRLEEIANRLAKEEVVYVSDAGMPIISDPGQILVEYCQKNAIKYDILPGATAFATAFAASGFEGSHFGFYAFLPHKGSDRTEALNQALNASVHTILYESPHRLLKLLEELNSIDSNRELFLAKELTKKFQTYYRGNVKELLEQLKEVTIKGEWVVIIHAKMQNKVTLGYNDILTMELQPKVKAKLLAKVSDKSVKECYNMLIDTQNTAKV